MKQEQQDFLDSVITEELETVPAELLAEFESQIVPDEEIDFWPLLKWPLYSLWIANPTGDGTGLENRRARNSL